MSKSNLKNKSKDLQKAFLLLQTENEVFNFLRDLCTESEIEEFVQRLDIAKRLYNNETYKNIENEIWVSSTTIARVAKFLKSKWWGYKTLFRKGK